jgi:hypothetical protein
MLTLLSPVLFMICLAPLQACVYSQGNDFLFSIYSIYIFPISTSFVLIWVQALIASRKTKYALTYEEIFVPKAEKEFYRKMNVRLNVFMAIMLAVALFFLALIRP